MLVFDCEGEGGAGGSGEKKKRTCKMSEETRAVEKSVAGPDMEQQNSQQ